MPVIDSGYYATTFSAKTRNLLILPPGWDWPTTPQAITLGESVTLDSLPVDALRYDAANLEARRTAGGVETWGQASSASAQSQRSVAVAIVPPSTPGSYVAGDILSVSRLPRFPVCHRASRGYNRNTGFSAQVIGAYAARKAGNADDLRQLFQLDAVLSCENQFSPWAGMTPSIYTDPFPPNSGTSGLGAIARCIGYWAIGKSVATTVGNYDEVWRIFAPYANRPTARMVPDFCVDADLPTIGTVRVVWVDGTPHLMRTTTTAPPVSGSIQNPRQRSRNDPLVYGSDGRLVIGFRLPTDNGFSRSLMSPLVSFVDSINPGYAIRPSQMPTMRLRTVLNTLGPTATGISIDCYWRRERVTGAAADVVISTLGFSNIPDGSGNQQIQVDATLPALVDSVRGDRPGCYYFTTYVNYTDGSGAHSIGKNHFIKTNANDYGTSDSIFPDSSSDAAAALAPWPYDVPCLRFAADDGTTRYVGNAGWILPDHTWPSYTKTQPTLNKVGSTTTVTDGTITPTDATELGSISIQRRLRLWDPEKNLGATTTTTSVILASTGANLMGEARELVLFRADHMYLGAQTERADLRVNSALP